MLCALKDFQRIEEWSSIDVYRVSRNNRVHLISHNDKFSKLGTLAVKDGEDWIQ